MSSTIRGANKVRTLWSTTRCCPYHRQSCYDLSRKTTSVARTLHRASFEVKPPRFQGKPDISNMAQTDSASQSQIRSQPMNLATGHLRSLDQVSTTPDWLATMHNRQLTTVA